MSPYGTKLPIRNSALRSLMEAKRTRANATTRADPSIGRLEMRQTACTRRFQLL